MFRTGKIKAAECLILCCSLCIAVFSGCRKIDENNYSPPVTTSVTETTVPSAPDDADYDNYVYSQLTDKEKEYFDIIKEAAAQHSPEALFPEEIEPNELRKLFVSFYNDCEENFWIKSTFFRPARASARLSLTYRFDKEQAASMQEEIDEKVKEIFSAFDENTTDYEKYKILHDYLVKNCTYSPGSEYANTIYGGIVKGEVMCEGYAFSYDYLCKQAGLDCFTVWGKTYKDQTHAWNIIRLDGKLYHVDCTWDDPVSENVNEDFIRYYYFLVRDLDILAITHIPDARYFEWPACNDADNFYKREGFYCESPEDISNVLVRAGIYAADNGMTSFGVRCSDENVYTSAFERISRKGQMPDVLKTIKKQTSAGINTSKYIRYTNDDEYIIQVVMQDE
ncbi:MAG: hypothetical protein II936_01925 [Oscillospiraceae bacterium]|nr:hypothetical protein [Oscillospiraceae bacterium]